MTAPVRITSVVIALAVALLAFFPIADWIPGGHAVPWFDSTLDVWLSGGALTLGLGVILAIASRKVPSLWREDIPSAINARVMRHPVRFTIALVLASFAAYVWVALRIFDGRPLLIDEIAQVVHARIIASGALAAPADPDPQFFSALHVVDYGGAIYSHFPIGGPAMLAFGELLGASWIVGPLCAAGAVAAFCWMIGAVEARPGVRVAAPIIFAFAPFTAFMAGSHMNHVSALLWITVGMAGLARTVTAEKAVPVVAFFCGLGFGLAATVRPSDAVVFAVPAGIWLLVRALRSRKRAGELLAAGAGIAIPLSLLLWANANTTGSPLLFAYEVLWGKNFALGFGVTSSGVVHSPLNGVELINSYLLRLGTHLYELPVPALLPAVISLALMRGWRAFDRYLGVTALLLLAVYSAYWHEGMYLGPRLLYPLSPLLALLSARSLPLLRDRLDGSMAYRTLVYSAIAAGAIGLSTQFPLRAHEYRSMLASARWDADSAARAAGVDRALVFVRESWGSQLAARLWALGISRAETERLYYRVDACVLEHNITRLEDEGVRGDAALHELVPLMRDSSLLVRASFTPDSSIRALPGSRYDETCSARVLDDREGFTPLAPLLLSRSTNIFARDLHSMNLALLERYPDRPIYLLRPASGDEGSPLTFTHLPPDSVRLAWRSGR